MNHPKPKSRWRHFKGGTYIVEGLYYHSETKDIMIAYRCENTGNGWVRPAKMWHEKVVGFEYSGPRFIKLED